MKRRNEASWSLSTRSGGSIVPCTTGVSRKTVIGDGPANQTLCQFLGVLIRVAGISHRKDVGRVIVSVDRVGAGRELWAQAP